MLFKEAVHGAECEIDFPTGESNTRTQEASQGTGI